ncbi:hypothetical protein L6452_16493 [Arctium lappa]|uniref:Uncharacterized protein n=1 Tax=Arctium lappa TaxID=4217 RepID=A0ACB9C140_ARCLA|nr:hypothetical protein L6452_16493 [Arctium lappa]
MASNIGEGSGLGEGLQEVTTELMDDFDPFYVNGIYLGLGEGMDVEEDENSEESMEEYENNLEAMKVDESDNMVEVLVDKGNMIDDVEVDVTLTYS